MPIFFLMLSRPVVNLETVKTDSLKFKPDRRALMVLYQSILPWMMFVSARILKDIVYPKSKLAQQMRRWDGLLDIIIHIWEVVHGCTG